MKRVYARFVNFAILSVLPFVYGCQGGDGSVLGSLFGGSSAGGIAGGSSAGGISSGGSLLALSGTSGTGGGGGGTEIATISQPEPATMLLLGGGLIAMAFYSKRNRKN